MANSTAHPKSHKNLANLAYSVAFVGVLFVNDLSNLDWKQVVLIAVVAAALALAVVLELKDWKANKAWQKTQPPVVDPYEGGPDLPHTRMMVATGIGLAAFCYFASLGVAHRDTPLQGNDWWMFLLLPVALAGLGYARWLQTKYDKAAQEWRLTKPRSQY